MLKFVTFNIRCDFGQDGENCFCYRKPLILNKLEKEKPDIICFQEVLPHVAEWLKEELKEYYVVGCGRSETLRDEQLAIAYRPERLNLISMAVPDALCAREPVREAVHLPEGLYGGPDGGSGGAARFPRDEFPSGS